MRVTLTKTFRFESAHRLPKMPEGHKCQRLHGHSFRFEVAVSGPIDPDTGLLIDYGEIKRVVDPIRAELDHRYLNDIDGLENPTSEVIAVWLWDRIKPHLPELVRLTVCETCTTSCVFEGPDH